MQYEADSPKQYLEMLDADWRREKLLELRELILKTDSKLEEDIHYKMLGYRLGAEYVMHLNAQRSYVSLYVGNIDKIDPKGTLLNGVKRGKGCLRFTKSICVDSSGVAAFIDETLRLAREGADIGC
jgi:uncharacterized protein YdhG (YjbR/CyaY superfamily)